MTTLLVGVAGLAGVLSRWGLSRLTLHSEAACARRSRVGFLGGFTTFSTFSVQVVLEAEAGKPGRAAVYLTVSVVGGVAAAAAGYVLGRAGCAPRAGSGPAGPRAEAPSPTRSSTVTPSPAT